MKKPSAASSHPFSRLTPDWILDAIESVGVGVDGRLSALNSYENRVWQAGLVNGGDIVVKFYRPNRWTEAQLLEEHEFVADMKAAELPVVAPLTINGSSLHSFSGFHFAIFPRQGGRAPEFESPEVLEWMGRLMARIHIVGARTPFVARERLDLDSFGYRARDALLSSGVISEEIVDVWESVVNQALSYATACFDRAGPVRYIRLHGDCHAGNVLWLPVARTGHGGGPFFVDFDDARMGPAIQDLWMLLSGEENEMAVQLQHVLRGYESMRDFDYAELQIIEALRTLRLLHHSAWLAKRWDDPAFPAAFPWFSMPRYWEERILELREQVARMESAPSS
ncbi:MAG: serine/threonine protein kinase [Rhodocyclaceae bacterium]|nr:serine/threonine protein kinase [Rhodocyclaceae bacterium]